MVRMNLKALPRIISMTWETDNNEGLTCRWGKGVTTHHSLPDQGALMKREMNMRVYRGNADSGSKFGSMIINLWG